MRHEEDVHERADTQSDKDSAVKLVTLHYLIAQFDQDTLRGIMGNHQHSVGRVMTDCSQIHLV